MSVSRRSFLVGAVAVPAGIILPPAIAKELELPPAEPKPGERLIIYGRLPEKRHRTVIRMADLRYGHSEIAIVDDDGSILGVYWINSMQMNVRYERLVHLDSRNMAVRYAGPTDIDLTMVRVE